MVKYMCLFLLVFYPSVHFAQSDTDPIRVLAQVMKWFDQPSMEISSTYQAYTDVASLQPVEVVHSTFRKKDTLQYLQLGHIEMVRGIDFGLNVNHKEKYLILQTSSPGVKKIDFSTQADWVGLSKICSKIAYEKKGKNGVISMEFGSGEFEKASIAFDAKSYKPLSVDTYRRISKTSISEAIPVTRLLITYDHISLDPKHPEGIFGYQSFLEHSHKKWLCLEKYNQYKLTIN